VRIAGLGLSESTHHQSDYRHNGVNCCFDNTQRQNFDKAKNLALLKTRGSNVATKFAIEFKSFRSNSIYYETDFFHKTN
jgi:hypothetical protein